jgi:hypothetical protein
MEPVPGPGNRISSAGYHDDGREPAIRDRVRTQILRARAAPRRAAARRAVVGAERRWASFSVTTVCSPSSAPRPNPLTAAAVSGAARPHAKLRA